MLKNFINKLCFNGDQRLGKHHLHGSCLELEITEGAALLHLDEAIEKMHQLRELGVKFTG